jgi:PPM family protein phosphatase
VTVDFGARSQRGSLRPVNDDHYLILRLGRHQETLLTSLPAHDVSKRFDEFAYGMVIADGMGRGGEEASRLAISTLVRLATYFGKWHVRIDEAIGDEVMDRAQRFYRGVNAALLEASRDNRRSYQTTLTAIFSAGTELFFVHVGHSRAYLFRDDRLFQLTYDHTLDRRRPGEPRIVDVTAGARDQQHIMTRTLGGPSQGGLKIDVERLGLLHGDAVLLCTNGLTDVIEDEQIAATLLSHGTPDDRCRALVDLAVESGSTDDVTVLVGQYQIPPEPVSTEGG